MDDETRRGVDEACLRLLGYHDLMWDDAYGWSARDNGGCIAATPSVEEEFIVPLAKALRAKGWHVAVRSCWLSDQWAAQLLHGGREITEYANTMPLALALAAARAVGEEQTNDKI